MQPQGWSASRSTTRRSGAVQLVDALQSIRVGVRSWSHSRISAAPFRSRATVKQPPIGPLAPARESMRLRRASSPSWRATGPQAASIPASPRMQALTMKRPVELVWRANPNGAATPAGDDPPAAMTFGKVSSSARPTPPTAPASRASDKGVVWTAALDPLLADRLAEDVIRRIDRRARIERERRGL
jgi:hypothetical protein